MRDVHKPRYRRDGGLKIKLVNKDFFDLYIKKFPKSTIDSYSKMKVVLHNFHNKVTDIISTERNGFDLVGLMYLVTFGFDKINNNETSKHKYINYKVYNEHDIFVPHLNLDTDGKMCKIFFSMNLPKHRFSYKKSWRFRACRLFKKKVSMEFRKNYQRFIIKEKEDPYRKIFNSIM